MEMERVLICVALMALVTYIPKVLPGYDFQKTDSVALYPFLFGLYTLCSAGGTDVSGCIFFHRAYSFCSRGHGSGSISGLQGKEPGGGSPCRHFGRISAGTGSRSGCSVKMYEKQEADRILLSAGCRDTGGQM